MTTVKVLGSMAALPQTGQVTDSDYDDGYFQVGHPATGSARFVDGTGSKFGVTTDKATGLMWVKQPSLIIPGNFGVILRDEGDFNGATDTYVKGDLVNDVDDDNTLYVCFLAPGAGPDDPSADGDHWVESTWSGDATAVDKNYPAQFNWADALTACQALDYCGYTDWRLSNLLELLCVVDVSEDPVRLFDDGFGGDQPYFGHEYGAVSDIYLASSTTYASNADYCYANSFKYAEMRIYAANKSSASLYVYPVRGGVINA